jgi:hypothetical protein
VRTPNQKSPDEGGAAYCRRIYFDSSLPNCLRLTRGQISGRARESGEFMFTVRIILRDAEATQRYRIRVR